MPTDTPALGTVPNVELARTGSWNLSSGEWNPKPEDFAAAVAALNCPAIRAPRIRLGHVDPRFDGEPAVGSVTNLRVDNGGHSLVGDLSQVPGWLPNVISAAYPDRSVEGMYDFTCQIGHRHPFVLTGLALLGVTAPGVGTLRSIDDVGTMYGITTAEPIAAGRPVAATFTAAADGDDNSLKRYWVHGEGTKRWVHDRHPWSKLVKLLTDKVGPERAKRIASSFFKAHFGYWPGSRKGSNPVGPG